VSLEIPKNFCTQNKINIYSGIGEREKTRMLSAKSASSADKPMITLSRNATKKGLTNDIARSHLSIDERDGIYIEV